MNKTWAEKLKALLFQLSLKLYWLALLWRYSIDVSARQHPWCFRGTLPSNLIAQRDNILLYLSGYHRKL